MKRINGPNNNITVHRFRGEDTWNAGILGKLKKKLKEYS